MSNSLIIFTHVSFALISRRERELLSRKPTVRLDAVEVGQRSEKGGFIQEVQKKKKKHFESILSEELRSRPMMGKLQ